MKSLLFIFGLVAILGPAGAESTSDYSVQVSASVQASPAQITLTWPQDSSVTPSSYSVFRKAPESAAWDSAKVLTGSTTSFVDNSVVVGTGYEYQIVKATPSYNGYGYIRTGIAVSPVEARGKVILMVEQTKAAVLSAELTRLELDLIGDGWTVLRHDVSTSDSVSHVKALITADYRADAANVNTVFLFGHIPVPYSGLLNPDGHSQHLGAWPADVYYGDMDGTWTDNVVNYTQTSNGDPADAARLTNLPGDGKFDQTTIPAVVKLQVGRVDLANMPGRATPGGVGTFPSEVELLRQYLNKDHAFRQKLMTAQRRGLVADNFGVISGEAFAASGFRNFAPFFGAQGILDLGSTRGAWVSTLKSNDYLWAYGCGPGGYTYSDGLGSAPNFFGTSAEIVANDIRAVFVMVFGSWFGDWDHEDDLLRAVLATPTYGLVAAWAGRPHWFFHPMAMGETAGYCALLTQNNVGLYSNQLNANAHSVHIALMGDPTLRMHVVGPPNSVMASQSNAGMNVSWTASTDAIAGYLVYRAPSAQGPFTRVSAAPITGTRFADTGGILGNVYQVRAVKLETTPSGSYYNLSQGAFGVSGLPVFTSQPVSQTVAPGNSVTFTVQATGATQFQWEKDGSLIPGAVAATLTLNGVSSAQSGTYAVQAINSSGTTTSTGAVLLVDQPKPGRLINLSVRAVAGSGDQTLIAGLVVSGNGAKRILLRAIGPTLANFAVSGFLADPQLSLFQNSTLIASNDSWDTAPNVAEILAANGNKLGQYTLNNDEPTIFSLLGASAYTTHVTGAASGSGVALMEVYDTDSGQPGTPTFDAQPRLVNISARAQVGTGANILIAGFVINGNVPKRVMIRGVGPTLANFGVGNLLADPHLGVFDSNASLIAENDNWPSAPNVAETIAANGEQYGAFQLDPLDSVLVLTLVPGAYTAQVSGVNNSTGVALVEVDELP